MGHAKQVYKRLSELRIALRARNFSSVFIESDVDWQRYNMPRDDLIFRFDVLMHACNENSWWTAQITYHPDYICSGERQQAVWLAPFRPRACRLASVPARAEEGLPAARPNSAWVARAARAVSPMGRHGLG